MKVGIEVEGRYRGLDTVFCSDQEFIHAQAKIIDVMAEHNSVHVYISDHNNVVYMRSVVAWLEENGNMVTIERTKMSKQDLHILELFPSIHVMLNISEAENADDVWNLRPTDQIKFHRSVEGESMPQVMCMPVECLYHTKPSEFLGDLKV